MNGLLNDQHRSVLQYLIRLHHEGVLQHAMLFVGSSSAVWDNLIQQFLSAIQPSEIIRIHNEDEERKNPIITVKQMHELQQKLSRKSIPGRLRIILIPCAEELTSESGNALLKMLEEPPIDTLFLLKAFNRLRVLSTIVSRCAAIKLSEKTESVTENRISLTKLMRLSLSEKMIECASLTKNDIQGLLTELEFEIIHKKNFLSNHGVTLYQELLNAQMGNNGLREQSMRDALCLSTSI